MKNKTILLGMALAIFALQLMSCQKENINPTELAVANDLIDPPTSELSDKEIETIEVLTSMESSFTITVSSTPCSLGGYSLTVNSAEVNLGDGNYTINWYKNTEQTVYFEGQTLECVCGFGVRIQVLDNVGDLSAETSLDIPGC